MDYCYLFYHHCVMSEEEQDKVLSAIKKKDFEGFKKFYDHYNNNKDINPHNWTFFKDHITIFKDHEIIGELNVLDEGSFRKITSAECECG